MVANLGLLVERVFQNVINEQGSDNYLCVFFSGRGLRTCFITANKQNMHSNIFILFSVRFSRGRREGCVSFFSTEVAIVIVSSA